MDKSVVKMRQNAVVAQTREWEGVGSQKGENATAGILADSGGMGIYTGKEGKIGAFPDKRDFWHGMCRRNAGKGVGCSPDATRRTLREGGADMPHFGERAAKQKACHPVSQAGGWIHSVTIFFLSITPSP